MSERLIPESQLKQAVREVLSEMLGLGTPLPQASPLRQWYDTDPAYTLLGFDEAEQLREAVRSGLLRIGYEVRDRRKPQAKLPVPHREMPAAPVRTPRAALVPLGSLWTIGPLHLTLKLLNVQILRYPAVIQIPMNRR
jgi:hypothetical protein